LDDDFFLEDFFFRFFLFRFSSSDESDDESEDEEELEEELEDEEDAGFAVGFLEGLDFRCSLKSSVNPPKPIDVKKFIENLVLAGSSLGKSPSNASARVTSRIRSIILTIPIYSANSWSKILIRILDELVVSCSFK